ncbi:MAG: helix-turn-helix transcriptional regulator [Bacteroidetes bacterium]|nr:helix-turn-helix transcriptional regulator [Bacteroidota bacterium]
MKSERCKLMVKQELHKLGLHYRTIVLGEVELKENLSSEKLHLIDIALRNAGLELIEDKKRCLIDKIKASVEELINIPNENEKVNISGFISGKVKRDYAFLSNLFSHEQGITIEKYIIERKIDRIKELLVYSELSLGDIAFNLQYSSTAHLSNQFKKVTGLTPSFFRQIGSNKSNTSLNV